MRRPAGPQELALALAVGLAFADSSIVMLGLPEIYGELDASIPGVSLVITSYNLVVAVAALALVPVVRRARPAPMLALGLVVFAGASLACGLADDLGLLVAMRGVQGLGGALLLAASLPAMAALARSPVAGRARWGVAGTVGAALGPAAGGVLTELADWRAIFLAQAPVAVAALAVVADPRVRALGPRPGRARVPAWPNVGLGLAFGALVGALFLAVLMVVTVWGLGPLRGAVVVSLLPLAAALARPLARRADATAGAATGALLLAAGLVALALLPAVSAWWAAAALAVCGAGFGLLVPPLTSASLAGGAEPAVAGSVSVGARHAGLVVALAIVAPVLAADLDAAAERATLGATRVILDAPLGLPQKVPVALDLAGEFERTPRGAVPDLEAPFARAGAADDAAVRAVRDDLVGAIESSLTRGFRGAYLVSAGFALLALLPVAVGRVALSGPGGPRAPPRAAMALGAALAAGAGLVVASLAAGGADLGRARPADPCAQRAVVAGGGIDATVQRVVLDGLAGAACELDVTREELVLSFGPEVGTRRIPWDAPTVERAVRAGIVRSIDDAERRGAIPGPVATVLAAVAARAPVEELIRGGGALRDLTARIRDLDVDPGALLDRLRDALPG